MVVAKVGLACCTRQDPVGSLVDVRMGRAFTRENLWKNSIYLAYITSLPIIPPYAILPFVVNTTGFLTVCKDLLHRARRMYQVYCIVTQQSTRSTDRDVESYRYPLPAWSNSKLIYLNTL